MERCTRCTLNEKIDRDLCLVAEAINKARNARAIEAVQSRMTDTHMCRRFDIVKRQSNMRAISTASFEQPRAHFGSSYYSARTGLKIRAA